MGLSKSEFWRMTFPEFWAKYEVMFGKAKRTATKSWLKRAMALHPDVKHADA